MDNLEKKAIMLLHSLIFHCYGLKEEESILLEELGQKFNAVPEMKWANKFIAIDHISAFDRARGFLQNVFIKLPVKRRLKHLINVWEVNYVKGYFTEIEIKAILMLSKDFLIKKEFLKEIKKLTK